MSYCFWSSVSLVEYLGPGSYFNLGTYQMLSEHEMASTSPLTEACPATSTDPASNTVSADGSCEHLPSRLSPELHTRVQCGVGTRLTGHLRRNGPHFKLNC